MALKHAAAVTSIWILWLIGFVPLLAWLIPAGRASSLGLYGGGVLLLAYFFAPPILLTRLFR